MDPMGRNVGCVDAQLAISLESQLGFWAQREETTSLLRRLLLHHRRLHFHLPYSRERS